jgi:hypothetical protein
MHIPKHIHATIHMQIHMHVQKHENRRPTAELHDVPEALTYFLTS